MDLTGSALSFRACVYPSPDQPGYYAAHCLELDVVGEGKSVEEAMSNLLEVIETQLESCQDNGAQLLYFAPNDVWQKYNAAKKAGRQIAGELIERIVRQANKRLGHAATNIFDNVVGSNDIPRECLMTA